MLVKVLSFVLFLHIALAASAQPSLPIENANLSSAPSPSQTTAVASSSNFTLMMAPNAVGATANHSGAAQIIMEPADGFTDPVSFECSGLPAGAACTFAPSTLVPNGNPVKIALLVTYSRPLITSTHLSPFLFPVSALGCCLVFLKRKNLRAMTLLLIAFCTLIAFTGCGSDHSSLRTYTVNLTATSGSDQLSVPFLLSVE